MLAKLGERPPSCCLFNCLPQVGVRVNGAPEPEHFFASLFCLDEASDEEGGERYPAHQSQERESHDAVGCFIIAVVGGVTTCPVKVSGGLVIFFVFKFCEFSFRESFYAGRRTAMEDDLGSFVW